MSGETSKPGSGRETATRALMRMSSASCASRKAIVVTPLPKKSAKSERSAGSGAKDSDEAIDALHAGDGRRHDAHLMAAAGRRRGVVVVQMKPDVVEHDSLELSRNRPWTMLL